MSLSPEDPGQPLEDGIESLDSSDGTTQLPEADAKPWVTGYGHGQLVDAPPEKVKALVGAFSKASPGSAEQQVKNRIVEIIAWQQGWSATKALNFVRDHAPYASPLPARTRSHAAPRPRASRGLAVRCRGSRRTTSSRGSPGDDDPGESGDPEPVGTRLRACWQTAGAS